MIQESNGLTKKLLLCCTHNVYLCLKLNNNMQEERAVCAAVREPRPGEDSFPGPLRPRVGLLPGGIRGLQGQVWGWPLFSVKIGAGGFLPGGIRGVQGQVLGWPLFSARVMAVPLLSPRFRCSLYWMVGRHWTGFYSE